MNIRRPFLRLSLMLLPLLAPFAAGASEIYVLTAEMERDGVSSISPTFIVTPRARALLSFDGERDLDVAMTLTPRPDASAGDGAAEAEAGAGAGVDADADAGTGEAEWAPFDLRVELVDGVELHDRTIPVSLSETATLELAGRTIKVLVRVQEPLGQERAPASDAVDGG